MQKDNNIEEYELYLSQYPKSIFAAIATARIAKLKAKDAKDAQLKQDEQRRRRMFVP